MSNELPTIQQVMEKVTAAAEPTIPAAVEPSPEAAVGLETSTPAPEAPAAPEAKPERPARLFAEAKRREEALRAKQAELENRQKEFDARAKSLSETETKLSPRKEDVLKDPLKVIKEMGISLDDLTRAQLGQYEAPVKTAQELADEKLAALEAKLTAFQEQQSKDLETKAQVEQAQREAWAKKVIEDTVKTGKFEYIEAAGEGGVQLVRDVIQEYYERNNIQLDFKAACDIVEKHYEDDVVQRYLKTSKIQSYIDAEVSKRLPASQTSKKPQSAPTTLSNKQTTANSTATVDLNSLDKHDALKYLKQKHGL